MQWESLLLRVGPILAFLVCVTIVAELADGLGVFSTLAHGAARLACPGLPRVRRTSCLTHQCGHQCAVTAQDCVLSSRIRDRYRWFRRNQSAVTDWTAGSWTSIVAGARASALLAQPAIARQLLRAVCSLANLLVVGVSCHVSASRRSLLTWRLLPWQLVLGVGLLFILVQIAHDRGLGAALSRAAGHGSSGVALAQLCGVGAVGANLVDNLPSYLALEPAADASPLRLAALLVGVNAGPLITPWASLATLLWAARCRSAGVAVSWRRFAARGAVLVPLLLAMSVTSLWLAHG